MSIQNNSNDLYFVGYLYSIGIEPVKTLGFGNKRIFYYDSPQFKEIKDDYYSRHCSIEPIAYQQGIRLAKSIIYNN